MERKELKDVSEGLRKNYQYAKNVFAKGDSDYAILLLTGILKKEAGFMEARDFLRTVEKNKALSLGAFGKIIADIKIFMLVMKGKSKVSKEPTLAMEIAEDALALNIKSLPALNLLAEAAQNNEAYFIAIEAMELARSFNPDDEVIMKSLVDIYKEDGNGAKAYELQSVIAAKHPDDLNVQAELRSAAALATLNKAQNQEGSSVQLAVDKAKAEGTTLGDKIIRSEEDIATAISNYETAVTEGDDSIDNRRALAELYQRASRHDEAIAAFRWIAEKIGTLDPATDKAIEKSEVAKFDDRADELGQANASDDEIQAIVNEKFMYKLERAEERVRNYPNDTQLRYDLACLLWDGQDVARSLEQFQLARKNPQRRLSCTVYIGMCFSAKGQFDMAVEQYEEAISGMPIMDKDKINALYQFGLTCETMENKEKALDCFKQIYQTDVNYLDVAERMEKYYK